MVVLHLFRAILPALLAAVAVVPSPVRGATSAAPARPAGIEEAADLVVAQDGSGDYRTVQEALDALACDAPEYRIILIRRGVFREKVRVRASKVALVGEDREGTRLVFSELRSSWRQTHPDDWGAAVVNLGQGVEDVVLANLTIHNDYGRDGTSHDHQFAVRGGQGVTRVSVLHSTVVADGGDTIALWNTESGMYYHAYSSFEGHVDYFCPRGWAYARNCRFFGHGSTASIWHDGSGGQEQKLVIRDSRFDGEPGFALGRFTRDDQIVLVDCELSARVADRAIYLARDPASFLWGLRVYLSGCRLETGTLPWLADNLGDAPGAPDAEAIDARWTFGGRWDPEATLPAVLPFPSLPTPRDGDRRVDPDHVLLRWLGARNAVAYDVRLGESDPPPVVSRVGSARCAPGRLAPDRMYTWRVDAVTPEGVVEGAVWRFRTGGPGGGPHAPGRDGVTCHGR